MKKKIITSQILSKVFVWEYTVIARHSNGMLTEHCCLFLKVLRQIFTLSFHLFITVLQQNQQLFVITNMRTNFLKFMILKSKICNIASA